MALGMNPEEFLKTFGRNDQITYTGNSESSNSPLYPLIKYIHV
jgi:hypothetical protein